MADDQASIEPRAGDVELVASSVQAARDALAELQRTQAEVDESHWMTSSEHNAKRRHIGFHLTIAAAKLARVEERVDHGEIDDSVLRDVAADLFIYAMQLANLRDDRLAALLETRWLRIVDDNLEHPAP